MFTRVKGKNLYWKFYPFYWLLMSNFVFSFQLAERVLTCVEHNTLAIEPIVGDTNSFPK